MNQKTMRAHKVTIKSKGISSEAEQLVNELVEKRVRLKMANMALIDSNDGEDMIVQKALVTLREQLK